MSISAALVTTVLSIHALASSVEVPTPASQILAPTGFSEADNAVVLLSGEFPNTCYKVGTYQTKIDAERKHIVVDAKSTTERDAVCALRMVPFVQAIELGALEAGEYKVTLAGNPNVESRSLVIEPRSQLADGESFASVREAKLEVKDGQQLVNLSGDYPLTFVGCALIDKIEVKQIDEKMLVIEPFMKLYSTEAPCEGWSPRFDVNQPLRNNPLFPAEDMVLFVKTADGSLVRIDSIAP